MPFRRTRLLAPALLTTAGLAVAGCGGGGSNGDKATYVKTFESNCKDVAAAFSDLREKASSASGSTSAKFKPVQSATEDFFASVKTSFKALADADAPKEFSDFQDKFESGAKDLLKQIDDASDKVGKATDLPALGVALKSFGSLKVEDVKLPDGLLSAAPACRSLDGATAGG